MSYLSIYLSYPTLCKCMRQLHDPQSMLDLPFYTGLLPYLHFLIAKNFKLQSHFNSSFLTNKVA
uniref:Uncharacterized protein n=1 Tax=Octopus bimaculoides TaxID=37653 RepID=A0A0L8HDP1_OCTBM